MVIRVSTPPEGRTISTSPETTTKNGTFLSPCSMSTWPDSIVRISPCGAMRRICAGVNVGNICSNRELTNGSPLCVSLIEVICAVLLLTALFLEPLSARRLCCANELRSWVSNPTRSNFYHQGNYVVKLRLFLVILGQNQ